MKKRLIVSILCGCFVCASVFSFIGCVKKTDNSDKTVEVLINDAGYGIKWFEELETIFENRTDYNVEFRKVGSNDNTENAIRSGAKNNTVDLFITGDAFGRYIDNGSKMVDGYDYCLEPLDDVMNYTPEGETRTIGEKMWAAYRNSIAMDVELNGEIGTHYFYMPWASGFGGLFYNTKLYEDTGLSGTPRTTKELVEYCRTLKNAGIMPFIHSSEGGYWEYIFNIWWAQYETLQGIDNFYNAKISDTAIPDAVSSMGIFDQKGIKYSLEAISSIIDPGNEFLPELVESLDYTTAQARFLAGQAAMMPNGDWLENEMKKSGIESEYIMPMKTPILSDIAEKCSFASAEENVREQNLRALVDYVDGKAGLPTYDEESNVKADVAIVEKARKVSYTIGNLHGLCIPAYATAKEGAKEFLKLMYSDEGLAVYMRTTSGSLLPFDYDYENNEAYSSLSNFAKTKLDILSYSEYMLMPGVQYRSSYIGGLVPVYRSSPYEILLGSRDSNTRTTPEKLIQDTKSYYSSRLEKVLRDSGLL